MRVKLVALDADRIVAVRCVTLTIFSIYLRINFLKILLTFAQYALKDFELLRVLICGSNHRLHEQIYIFPSSVKFTQVINTLINGPKITCT